MGAAALNFEWQLPKRERARDCHLRQVQAGLDKRTATIKLISIRNKKKKVMQKNRHINYPKHWLYLARGAPPPPLTQSINSGNFPFSLFSHVCCVFSLVLPSSASVLGRFPCAINLIAPINMQHLAVIIARARLFICFVCLPLSLTLPLSFSVSAYFA